MKYHFKHRLLTEFVCSEVKSRFYGFFFFEIGSVVLENMNTFNYKDKTGKKIITFIRFLDSFLDQQNNLNSHSHFEWVIYVTMGQE